MVQETSLPPTLDAAAWGAMPVRCVLVVFVFSLASTTVSSQNVATTSATLLDSLVVRVQFRREHEAVLFLLCDDSRCTKLSLASNVYESKGGLMVYHAENCSRWGSDCEVYDSTWVSGLGRATRLVSLGTTGTNFRDRSGGESAGRIYEQDHSSIRSLLSCRETALRPYASPPPCSATGQGVHFELLALEIPFGRVTRAFLI
ncbi:hypothetical protein ONE63_011238 [Megalurothrips usitatus]|uniref:Uncharacterized protein n=1 Tax=Megalurothrips usitatus TaxID=439358 RepID=A0AAV7X579_9NEOP|nr:hypothetical protein ONE63_011238 [Megalurothrips usitatus]